MTLEFHELKSHLKQRFPLLMVDRVIELEPGKRVKALKNVTGSEIQFLGHFPDYAIMPGTLIVEAIGQSASILFSQTAELGLGPNEWLVLGIINNMRFLTPVVPGSSMILEVHIIKVLKGFALVQGTATVDKRMVAEGRITFGLAKSLAKTLPEDTATQPV